MRPNLLLLLLGVLSLVVPTTTARAQSFSFDAVMVSRFWVEESSLTLTAYELHDAIEDRLGAQFLIVEFADVPEYSPGYSAEMYLDACPVGEYVGCSYVLGSRANANWVVTGELTQGPPNDTITAVISIVDVSDSSVVLSFSAIVTDDNHASIADGVSMVLGRVIGGESASHDIRGDVESDREAWERRRDEAREAAEELASSDEDLEVSFSPTVERVEEPRLTAADLEQYEGRDDVSPWVRLDMPKWEYVRYKNSDRSLSEWRRISNGRFRRLMLTLDGGIGKGAHKHVFDGRWVQAVDAEGFYVAETDAWQQIQPGPFTSFGVEAAFGVHEWLDVGFGVGTRAIRFSYYFWREVEGEVGQEILSGEKYKYTPEYRLRVNLIPMPILPVRPTFTTALMYWRGKQIDEVINMDPIPIREFRAPVFVMLQVGPGAEISAHDSVILFARLSGELVLSGTRLEEEHTGDNLLQESLDPPLLLGATGVNFTAGVTIRLGPIGGEPWDKPTRWDD